jgi:hypothetical protein
MLVLHLPTLVAAVAVAAIMAMTGMAERVGQVLLY